MNYYYTHTPNLTTPAWIDNNDTGSMVPFHFELPSGVMVRVEGRNNSTEEITLVGYVYTSGTLICPFFKQYRVTRVRSTEGAAWTESQINRSSPAGNLVRMAQRLQPQRRGATGARKGGYRTSLILPLDFIPASGTGADKSKVVSGVATKDFTNCRSGTIQSGETAPYSVKMQSLVGSSSTFEYDFTGTPVDITGGTGIWPTVYARVWMDTADLQVTGGNAFRLTLGLRDGDGTTSNLILAAWNQFTSSATLGPGWNDLWSLPNNVASGLGGYIDPSLDPETIDRFQLFVQPNAGVQCSMTLDTIQFLVNTAAKKYIVFRDDDGYALSLNTAREFDKNGIRGNFAVLPSLIGTSGYMTLADLRALRSAGHLINSHGWTKFATDEIGSESVGPFAQQRLMTPEAFWRDVIEPAMFWLQDNGFEDGARIYTTHQGNMTPNQRDLLLANGIELISHTSPSGEQAHFVNHLDNLQVQYATGYAATTTQGMLDLLDYAGGVGVMYGHGNTSGLNANFAAAMTRVRAGMDAGTYKNVTFTDIVNGLGGTI